MNRPPDIEAGAGVAICEARWRESFRAVYTRAHEDDSSITGCSLRGFRQF